MSVCWFKVRFQLNDLGMCIYFLIDLCIIDSPTINTPVPAGFQVHKYFCNCHVNPTSITSIWHTGINAWPIYGAIRHAVCVCVYAQMDDI